MKWKTKLTTSLIVWAGSFLALGDIALADEGEGGRRHVTFGDVQSAFNNMYLAQHHPSLQSALRDGGRNGRASAIFGESLHCEQEWITVNVFFGLESDYFSRSEYEQYVGSWYWVFYLNEAEHDHMTSTTKLMPDFLEWYKSWGYFIEPGELEVGLHTVGVDIFDSFGNQIFTGDNELEIVSHDEHLAMVADGTWLIEDPEEP